MSITLKPYANLDIIYTLNDDVNIEFTRQDINSNVIDITGYTYIFNIREVRGGAVIVAIPMTVTDPTNGIAVATEQAANLTDLSNKNYVFDIEETVSSISTTIIKGEFKVERE